VSVALDSGLYWTEEDWNEEGGTPRFTLGRTLATRGALEVMRLLGINSSKLLDRHITGDWGDLDDADKQQNELSVNERFRILSAYKVGKNENLWVITEADSSVTTILLPSED
jgi:hypothetical protein